MVAEPLDALGQARVGEDRDDLLQPAIQRLGLWIVEERRGEAGGVERIAAIGRRRGRA